MYLLKILFIITLFFFLFGELLRFTFGNNVNLKPIDFIVGVIALWICFTLGKNIFSYLKRFWYLWIFPLMCLLSLIVNSTWLKPVELLISSFYLLRFLVYLGLFFAVLQFDKKFKKVITYFLLIGGLVILLFGYIQYFFFNDLKPLYYLGWDDHMYRLFTVFLDPNFAGGFLVLLFLLLLGKFTQRLYEKKKTTVALFKKYKISYKAEVITSLLILASTFMGVLVTFSRSSLLMLIVGTSTFLLLIGKKRLVGVVLGIILLFVILISSHFNVESINLFREASSDARIGNYKVALSIFYDKPLLGVGFDSYRYAKNAYGIYNGWTNAPSHADAGVDNSFLFVLVTSGFFGFVAYIVMWYNIVAIVYRKYRLERDIHSAVYLASIIGLFVHAMFLNSLFFPAYLLWMWILLGLTVEKKEFNLRGT